MQTILHVSRRRGKRTGSKVKAIVVPRRTKEVLVGNIQKFVKKGKFIQTDGLKSYAALATNGYNHASGNHKRQFVLRSKKGIIHTNTIESAHAVMKKKARRLNLFVGQKTSPLLERKIDELAYRYNNRDCEDKFLLVLCCMLLSYPCCGKNYVLQQLRNVLL